MPAPTKAETLEDGIHVDYGKSQVIDDTPKVIKALHFGVLSDQDVINQSQVELVDRRIYDLSQPSGRRVAHHGPLDKRMGVSAKTEECTTCKQPLQHCNGHFGHVKLVLPVFHVGYFKKIISVLQSICKDCSCILLSEVDRRKFLKSFQRASGDSLRQNAIVRRVADQAKKTKTCFECGAINGLVRKAATSSLKISHDRFKTYNSSTALKKIPPPEKIAFDESFTTAKKTVPDLEKHLKRAMDDVTPLRALKLFRRVRECDLELLGLGEARPESFLWRYIPAPPVAIRPSVGQEGATTEDDITAKLGDIIFANQSLRDALAKGAPVQSIVEHWDYLSLQLAMYINSDVPGLAKGEGKAMRGFVQRLKGKQGRFRGNLSGKRVDFSGRTVISPDPNLKIDEVAVPILVAKNMTYPELVTRYNIEKLRIRVKNGGKVWPGANYVYKAGNGFRHYLKLGNNNHIAEKLQEGDLVERHLEDGDIVLFNRQPSLHKLSILCHYVKVRPHRTFRLNECVCNPYNADFDGDEMNLHVPQTEEARTEALQLMGVKYNLTTPKNGEPIIAAIQDFISACWLLSSLDVFYDRKNFVTVCLGMLEPDVKFDLPPPSIIKPQALWTGKQVFNVLIRPNKKQQIFVNLDAPCRDHKNLKEPHRDLQDDSFLCIKNSEVMCGRMDKGTVGSGQKKSLFYTLVRDYGPDAAAKSMNRLSKLCARWLSNQGFSVGISDVTPPDMTVKIKNNLIAKVFSEYDQLVLDSKAGRLERKSGMDDAGTLESEQVRVLSTVRTDLADALSQQLSKRNSPMLMATSGSKGSTVNVAQMAALLGQQDIEGKRVPETFQNRTLPHFAKYERSPASLGFVYNSFFSGLTPYEFIFHGMGGRVGLVDTAVKTAETGYMSRRLIKSLEDLSTQYDHTVRNSSSNIVQFKFGDDELDPVDMEASAEPVDFNRTYAHVEAITFDMNDVGLKDTEIYQLVEDMLSPKRQQYPRTDLLGRDLPYDVDDEQFVDQNESARRYLRSIKDFVMEKSEQFTRTRAEKKHFTPPQPRSAARSTKRARNEEDGVVAAETSSARGKRATRRGAGAASSANPPSKRAKTKLDENTAISRMRADPSTKDRFDLTSKLSKKTLEAFIQTCLAKYERARVEPGHAVGAVGAQSIGEPGTQMTLKTFHFAGVAGMNLTAGVPRIKEIINASKDISTPVITCHLERRRDLEIPSGLARIVAGRIECLQLSDVTKWVQLVHKDYGFSCLIIKISLDTISELILDLTMHGICDAIKRHRRFKGANLTLTLLQKDTIMLQAGGSMKLAKRGATKSELKESVGEQLLQMQNIQRALPHVHILGNPTATRCVITAENDPKSSEVRALKAEIARNKAEEKAFSSRVKAELSNDMTARTSTPMTDTAEPQIKLEEPTASLTTPLETSSKKSVNNDSSTSNAKPIQMHKVMVEGYGLRFCMNTDGVDPYHTQTNSVIETLKVLGIEAARTKIIKEIDVVMSRLSVDPRHMALLADVMTYKGEVLGITRFGLAKMRDSVLQLASFEKTADHVFDAGVAGKKDLIEGVSECVIVGKTMTVGTGMVEVVRRLGISGEDLREKKAVFEQCWKESTR